MNLADLLDASRDTVRNRDSPIGILVMAFLVFLLLTTPPEPAEGLKRLEIDAEISKWPTVAANRFQK